MSGLIGREYTVVRNKNQPVQFHIDIRNPLIIDFHRKEHMMILAKSGSGKSYLAGVIAEEAIHAMDNYGVVILDPMGIMSTLSKPGDLQKIHEWNGWLSGREDVLPHGLNNIQVWVPSGDSSHFDRDMYDQQFSLQANQLSFGTLCYCFDLDPLDPQTNLFRKSQSLLQKENSEYTLLDLNTYILNHFDELHFKSQTAEALQSKLDALGELHIISKLGVDLSDMIKEGQVVVFDLSMSSNYTARIIVNFLAEQLLLRRKRITKKLLKAQESNTRIQIQGYIPPVQMIIDEAHNYLPKNPILKKYIKEGRNVGCMLTAISQSPDLTKDVYANIMHLFVGQLVFDDDIMIVKGMLPVEKNTKEFREQIKMLDVGCFYYYNMDSKIEKRIRVRPRQTMHPAKTELEDERKYLTDHPNECENTLTTYLAKLTYSPRIDEIPSEYHQELRQLIKEHHLQVILDPQSDREIIVSYQH